MSRYRITIEADRDADAIFEYIARDDVDAASAWITELDRKFSALAHSPRIGREQPSLGAGIRSFPYGRYNIYYRQRGAVVEIVRVLHSALDLASVWKTPTN